MAKALIFFLFPQRPIEKANSRGEAPQRRETHETIGLALVSARATGASGTEDNLPMNFSYNQGKLLGMTDDGLMAYSSICFGLYAVSYTHLTLPTNREV